MTVFLTVKRRFKKWLIQNKIPALGIGVISHGQLREIKVYGNYTKGKPAPFNTIWNVASLTKPVTAILALKLISMGKLSLDEPLYKYWIDPDIADDPNTRLLTARIILSHQTGFSNWRFENKSGKLEFQFKPGTKFQYSGEGFEYLKKALENKFHKTLDALAAEFIFEPLKLRDTHFFPDAGTDFSRFAIGFDKDGNEYQITKNNAASAADDLITTIGDYGTFLCSVMKGDGLDGEIFNEMISVQADMKQDKYFGLGFKVYDLGDGNRALSHGGSDKGVQTLFFILPKTKQGLILFTNSDQGSKIFASAITHFLGEKGKKIVEIEMR